MILLKELQFVKIDDNNVVMLNLINAAADILDIKTYNALMSQPEMLDRDIIDKMKERKYLFDTEEDYYKFLNRVNESINEAELNSPPCFLVIPTYECNLQCTYCYERTYEIENIRQENLISIINKQFEIIDNIVENYAQNDKIEYNSKKIRITIMGGEPLLKKNKEIIRYIFEKVNKRGYTVDIVTNGVDLQEFIDILKDECLDHIQITLDGTKSIHDKRRIFGNGNGSFEKIFNNIELALNNNIKIFLRVNVDDENIMDLPELARLLITKFNYNNNLKPYIYLLQDGGCSGDANVVKEEVGIEKIFELEHEYPQMSIFRKKFHPEMFINAIFNNVPFQPSLRHCGAAINQYIFDYKGNIYRCWHGIGNNNYSVGRYLPTREDDIIKNEKWKNRNTLFLKKCKECKYRYICGTGCPASKHKGEAEFDILHESCIEYEPLIETIIKEKMKF